LALIDFCLTNTLQIQETSTSQLQSKETFWFQNAVI